MQAFSYHHPASVADAVGKSTSDTRFLAGGQSLLPSMKLGLAAPEALIDLNGLGDLRHIKLEGDEVVIGAMATHAAVAASDVVKKAIPGLADLAGRIGDRQVRNRGTIGGALANGDPSCDYSAVMFALDATFTVASKSGRRDELEAFWVTAHERPVRRSESSAGQLRQGQNQRF